MCHFQMKLCDPAGKFWLRLHNGLQEFNDENLLGCKSEPISVRILLSIVINLSELEPA